MYFHIVLDNEERDAGNRNLKNNNNTNNRPNLVQQRAEFWG